MRHLIDTNWVIDALRGGDRSLRVQRRIDELAHQGIAMSVLSLAELSVGLHRTTEPQQARATLQDVIEDFSLLDVDVETCEIFGRIKAQLQRGGNPIENFDTMIAATALQHDLTLLTNNRRHFARIEGLRLESA